VEGRSRRETARLFGIARKTVDKMCAFSAPPGYRRRSPAAKPKLDGFTGIIDQILADDQRMPAKQKHTAKRIFERLRDEYGFAGHYTIVKSYIHDRQVSAKEMFVPLHHPAGHAQVDFGEAMGLIGGVARKLHFFCMDLPHSDAIFVKAYPAETTEAFLDGHVVDFFGKLPFSILYDNTALAVAAILGGASGQEPSPSCSRITCLRIGSAAPARATTKERSRVWSAMPGATSWYRCRTLPVLRI